MLWRAEVNWRRELELDKKDRIAVYAVSFGNNNKIQNVGLAWCLASRPSCLAAASTPCSNPWTDGCLVETTTSRSAPRTGCHSVGIQLGRVLVRSTLLSSADGRPLGPVLGPPGADDRMLSHADAHTGHRPAPTASAASTWSQRNNLRSSPSAVFPARRRAVVAVDCVKGRPSTECDVGLLLVSTEHVSVM